jgi:hypothetical protein
VYEGARFNLVNPRAYITEILKHLTYPWQSVETTTSYLYTVKLETKLARLLHYFALRVNTLVM